MIKSKSLLGISLILLFISNAYAKPPFPSDLSFSDAIDRSLALVNKGTYKNITILTSSGTLTGELLQKTKEVLILKTKTGSINLNSGKEKVQMSFVDIKTIESILIETSE